MSAASKHILQRNKYPKKAPAKKAGAFGISVVRGCVAVRSEEELNAAEELLDVVMRIADRVAVEVLDEEADVLEDSVLRTELIALRALENAIVRTHEGSVLAHAAICSISAPRTLVHRLIVAIVVLDLPSIVLIISLRVVCISAPETVLRIEAIAEVCRPDVSGILVSLLRIAIRLEVIAVQMIVAKAAIELARAFILEIDALEVRMIVVRNNIIMVQSQNLWDE